MADVNIPLVAGLVGGIVSAILGFLGTLLCICYLYNRRKAKEANDMYISSSTNAGAPVDFRPGWPNSQPITARDQYKYWANHGQVNGGVNDVDINPETGEPLPMVYVVNSGGVNKILEGPPGELAPCTQPLPELVYVQPQFASPQTEAIPEPYFKPALAYQPYPKSTDPCQNPYFHVFKTDTPKNYPLITRAWLEPDITDPTIIGQITPYGCPQPEAETEANDDDVDKMVIIKKIKESRPMVVSISDGEDVMERKKKKKKKKKKAMEFEIVYEPEMKKKHRHHHHHHDTDVDDDDDDDDNEGKGKFKWPYFNRIRNDNDAKEMIQPDKAHYYYYDDDVEPGKRKKMKRDKRYIPEDDGLRYVVAAVPPPPPQQQPPQQPQPQQQQQPIIFVLPPSYQESTTQQPPQQPKLETRDAGVVEYEVKPVEVENRLLNKVQTFWSAADEKGSSWATQQPAAQWMQEKKHAIFNADVTNRGLTDYETQEKLQNVGDFSDEEVYVDTGAKKCVPGGNCGGGKGVAFSGKTAGGVGKHAAGGGKHAAGGSKLVASSGNMAFESAGFFPGVAAGGYGGKHTSGNGIAYEEKDFTLDF